MSYSKLEPKVADAKRIDPSPKVPGKHHKKKYSPHWQVRSIGLWPSKSLKTSTKWHNTLCTDSTYVMYRRSEEYQQAQDFLRAGELDKALEIYTKYHPETAEWPVRFISVPAMVTTREVLEP